MAQTWRAIADSEVDPESPVTTSLAQAWRDNPEGIAAGVAGAPRIQTAAYATGSVDSAAIAAGAVGQSEIGAGAVHQGELDTASGSVSFNNDNRTLPGGQYGFYPQIRGGTQMTTQISFDIDTGGSYVTNIHANGGFDARQRYINSSPPYDLGDGECGLFIEVELDTDGKVIGTYVAPDPVWAHNGPTDIASDYTDKNTGKKYKRVRRTAVTRADVDKGRADLQDWIAAKREAPVEEVEITLAYKNADMDLFPHSLVSPPQGTIAMLDPVQTHDLLMLHEDGEDIADLLHKGFILPGDEVPRYGPPGVKMISFKWKRSKR